METVLKALQGKKTHILVLAYVVLSLLTSDPDADAAVFAGMDADLLKENLMALMVSTFKAGMSRVKS